MFEVTSVSTSAASASVQSREYFPREYAPGRWVIMHSFYTGEIGHDEDGDPFEIWCLDFHYGLRTGQPVTFSRLSDAERLCRVLNGEEAPLC